MLLGMLLWFSFSMGLQDGFMNINDEYLQLPPITAEIEIHAENEWLDIYGLYKNEMYKNKDFSFYPTQDTFTVGVSINVWSITLNYEHECPHPVSVMPSKSLVGVYGRSNKIFITFNSKK